MGFLSDEFYENLAKESAARQAAASVSPTPAPTPTPTDGSFNASDVINRAAETLRPSNFQINNENYIKTAQKQEAPQVPGIEPAKQELFVGGDNPMRAAGDLTPEQQALKFGGPVGSPEYWDYKEQHPVSSFLPQQLTTALSFGAIEFPDLMTWDKMSTTDKVLNITTQVGQAPFKLAFGFGKAITKSIPTLVAAVARPLVTSHYNNGKQPSLRELAQQERENPSDLIDPVYAPIVEKYDAAIANGHSPAVATITASLEGGLTIFNNLLASKMFIDVTTSLARPPARLAPGETIANTQPVSESLQKSEAALAQKAGAPKIDGPASQYASIDRTLEKQVQEKYGASGRIYTKVTPAGNGTVEVSIVEKQGPIESFKRKVGFGEGTVQEGLLGKERKLESHIVQVEGAPKQAGVTADSASKLMPLLDKPLKGFETQPITRGQVADLSLRAELNGIDPATSAGLMKVLTGKSIVGDLTSAEYLNLSKTLQSMNKVNQFVPDGGDTGIYTKFPGQYIQSPRGWMNTVQEKTGVPLRDLNLDMENGLRFSNTRIEPYMKWADDIFKGVSPEQRSLVDAYRTGNKAAIDSNPSLTPEVKANLKRISGEVEQFFDVAGDEFVLDTQRWRQGYMPDVAQRGGVVQMYKGDSSLPAKSDFFAEFERTGGNYVRINDPLVLMQIYARLGARAKYVSPVLERIKLAEPEIKTKTPDFYESFKSTIQEKLGYAGGGEKLLDEMSARVNKSLNRDLPPDLGRRTTEAVMSYAYANVLNSPGTWVRNQITNDVMLYARNGPEFYAKAKIDVNPLTETGKKIWQEAADAGFLNQRSAPYGEELGAANTAYKKTTQAILAPNSFVDNYGRVIAYYQTKLKFEDALSRYNKGELTWDQAASKMGMDGMPKVEANRVMRELQAKNVQGAFEELARSVIDETNFPYRRGEAPRVTYGTTGKVSTFLYKWQMEYAQTVGRWVKQGNWDSLIRYYSASASYINAFKAMNPGFDFSSTLYGAGPLNAKLPATAQTVLDIVGVIQSGNADNAQAIDDSREDLVKTLKSFGVPGGVDTNNWQAFWRSYSNGPVDAEGRYAVIGPKGDQTENPVYFHDLFYRMMGLPTETKVESAESKRARTNYEYEISQAKRKVAELRNAGKDGEADDIVLEWDAKGEDIEPGPRSYDRFDIPYPERQLERMTPAGQEKFESGVYK